jgi:hypothetical protein
MIITGSGVACILDNVLSLLSPRDRYVENYDLPIVGANPLTVEPTE